MEDVVGRMYTADGGRGSTASEASRMLEAALEQMDGIIQGAKYDLPQFDNFSIQVRLKKRNTLSHTKCIHCIELVFALLFLLVTKL